MTTQSDRGTPRYTIGTAASMIGVSAHTLRLYERRGLILVHRSGGKQRLYSEMDIERLKCLRTAITKHKISIEGIRWIQSIVPCWENVQCPTEQRMNCRAFTESEAGCWTYNHESNVCTGRDCLHCKVYVLSGDCTQIKSLVHQKPNQLSATTDISQEGQ